MVRLGDLGINNITEKSNISKTENNNELLAKNE